MTGPSMTGPSMTGPSMTGPSMTGPRRLRLGDGEGVAAVEFALIAPAVLGLVAIVLTAGIGLALDALVARGASITARALAVPADPYTHPPVYRDVDAAVAEANAGLVQVQLDPGDVTVTPADPAPGEPFVVEVSWTWHSPLAGLVGVLGPGVGGSDALQLHATAAGVRE